MPRTSISIGTMNGATEEQLDRAAALLVHLARDHGLVALRHAGRGRVVADVEPGRTYLDVARFELEAESLIGARIWVVPSGAPSAKEIAGRPISTSPAA